jgi:hypothetical protein
LHCACRWGQHFLLGVSDSSSLLAVRMWVDIQVYWL